MSSFPPPEVKHVAEQVAALLKGRATTVSVAETACGGLISAALLAQPGASKFYRGGLTVYTLPSRIAFAGWTQADLAAYKGPTPTVVAQLAKHTRRKLESEYCLGESGTAGPTGGETRNRTPGYCAIAVAFPDGSVTTREFDSGHGKRDDNMVEFARAALELLRDVLEGKALPNNEGEGHVMASV